MTPTMTMVCVCVCVYVGSLRMRRPEEMMEGREC